MKRVLMASLAVLVLLLAAQPALAWRGGGWNRGGDPYGHRGDRFGWGFGFGATPLFVPYPYYAPAPFYVPQCYEQIVPGRWVQVPVTDAYGYTTYRWQWVPPQTTHVCS